MCGLFCACVGFKLSLISNDAFKNKINPIRKVHFNKENINFFEQSKNTLLRPPSHYLKFGEKTRMKMIDIVHIKPVSDCIYKKHGESQS